MKKLVVAMVVVLGLSVSVHADPAEMMKKQCQYLIYGNGSHDSVSDMFMAGIVAGAFFNIPTAQRTEKSKASYGAIRELACKEALADNSTEDFDNKYLWGTSTIMDKRYTKYSKLK